MAFHGLSLSLRLSFLLTVYVFQRMNLVPNPTFQLLGYFVSSWDVLSQFQDTTKVKKGRWVFRGFMILKNVKSVTFYSLISTDWEIFDGLKSDNSLLLFQELFLCSFYIPICWWLPNLEFLSWNLLYTHCPLHSSTWRSPKHSKSNLIAELFAVLLLFLLFFPYFLCWLMALTITSVK